jgi:dTDP-4-dehydrorhamnose 3,5-epimerase-like enzyme
MSKENNVEEEPRLIQGGLAVDDRGEVGFVNGFDFAGVKRFYRVVNHQPGFVRAWHAHRYEAKYVTAMAGAAIVAAVKIDDWDNPSKDSRIYRHVLSANSPAVLYIPAGYANGFMSLTQDSVLVFFSTASLEEGRGDDVRYDARYWNPWEVVER